MKTEYCELLVDEIWSLKLYYLADIFEQLNKVNVSMQGRNKTLLASTDKVKALVEKKGFGIIGGVKVRLTLFRILKLIMQILFH